MNPRAQQQTIQKGRQDVRRGEVPSNLLDLLAMQKLADDKQRAKAEMDASMQSNPATIKDQLERQLMQSTKADVARQVGGALNQQQAQAQKRMSQIANQRSPAPNLLAGVAGNAAPNMARMAGGGIVAFAAGDLVEDQGPEDMYGSPVIEAFMEELRRENPRAFGNIDYERAADIYAQRFGRKELPVRGIARMAAERKQRQEEELRREQMRPRAAPYMDPYAGSEGILGVAGQVGPQPPQGIAAAPQPAGPQPAGPRITAPQVSAPKGPGIESLAPPPRKLEYKNPWATEDGMMIAGQLKDLYGRNIAESERDPYAEAEKRAALTDKITGRQGIMDLMRQGREARAAAVERQRATTPSLAWTSRLGGIGGLSDINRAMSAERAARNAAELANLDKDLAARQTEALRGSELGRESSTAAREGLVDIEAARRAGLTGATGLTEKMAGMISDQAKQILEVDKANLTAESANSRDRMEFVLGQMRNQTAIDVANLEARISMIRDATERTKVSAMNAQNRLELLRMTIADTNKLDSAYAKLTADALDELKLTEAYIDASKEGKEKLERKERELYEAARKKAAKENKELIQRLKGGLAEGFTSTERSS